MADPVTTLPPTLGYGHARARLIRGFIDGPDAGRTPDPRPATDAKIQLTPKNPERRVDQSGYIVYVSVEPITCSVDAEGYIVDGQGVRDVTLYHGWWTVKFTSTLRVPASYDVEVTAAHTAEAPLDLLAPMPPGGAILAPSEYAELDGRLVLLDDRVTALEAGGKVIVLGATDPIPGDTPAGTVIVRTA